MSNDVEVGVGFSFMPGNIFYIYAYLKEAFSLLR